MLSAQDNPGHNCQSNRHLLQSSLNFGVLNHHSPAQRGTVAAVRVLLADDHAEVRADLCVRLGKVFEIIAAVEDGKQAVDVTLRLDPDVVVLDISMPVVNGFQAAVYLRGVKCRAKIVFLTTYEDSEYVDAAFSFGADAYVTKQHFITDLVPAIGYVLRGNKYISPSLHYIVPIP